MADGEKSRRIREIIIIYIVLPLLVKYLFDLEGMLKVIPVLVLAVFVLIILLRDSTFPNGLLVRWAPVEWKWLLVRVAVVSLFTLVVVWFWYPHLLFEFPQKKVTHYLPALAAYPFISVLPQELVFRSWYYHRYKTVFSDKTSAVFVNSLCFAFMHVVYNNWIAIAGAFAISFIFSYNYHKYRSLPVLVLEHFLYGLVIFTVGLGKFFA